MSPPKAARECVRRRKKFGASVPRMSGGKHARAHRAVVGLLCLAGCAMGERTPQTKQPIGRDSGAENADLTERVDVGGYSLAIACTGVGRPTVVMETGFDDSAASWSDQLILGIAGVSRVCVYDRAGLGLSSHRPDRTDSGKVTADLHALLRGANVRPPFVFVGHSLGGMHVRVYTHAYPDEVAALVLIDSSHPAQYVRARERLSARDWTWMEKSVEQAYRDPSKEPFDWERSRQLALQAGHFGDLPLRVLSHDPTIESECSGDDCLTAEGHVVWEQLWQELQVDLATLSSRSTHKISPQSGHYIQQTNPDLVLAAITDVVRAVR